MKKTILKSSLLVIAGLALVAGTASAGLINDNRVNPVAVGKNANEDSLQTILDNAFAGYGDNVDVGVNVVNGQSNVAIWTPAEAAVDSYLISLITSGTNGQLGVYSYSDPSKSYFFGAQTFQQSFWIDVDGNLHVDNSKITGFGNNFGFAWKTGSNTYYTEDSKNNGNSMALAYRVAGGDTLLAEGLVLDNSSIGGLGITASGGNDWILAFEDNAGEGSDWDYQDAVFYIEDIKPVPEPATMMLFGAGLAGLAGIGRRRKK